MSKRFCLIPISCRISFGSVNQLNPYGLLLEYHRDSFFYSWVVFDAYDKSVHMHTDDFFHYLSKGAIPPHLPESNKQNLVVIEAFLEAAKRYARGGYDVIVDGIVGPWFLEPWKALAQEDYEVHYIVLRASKKETMKRAVERSKLDRKTNIELVETMWEQFSGLGIYESNVIDTTTFTIKDTVSAIKERVACGTSLLS